MGNAVADGYGFHQGFFHAHRFAGRGFPTGKGELSIPYDIGTRPSAVVRSQRPAAEPIVYSIGRMPSDRRAQLWRGVGTGLCFLPATPSTRRGRAQPRRGFKTYFRAGLETGTQLLRALAQPEEAILVKRRDFLIGGIGCCGDRYHRLCGHPSGHFSELAQRYAGGNGWFSSGPRTAR